MGIFRRVICPKCGEEHSAFRQGCPNCGARRQSKSRRTGAQSDTVRRGSAAASRREADSRWQMLFGLCLVAAVIIAVIVLIVTTVKGGYETYFTPSPSPSESIDISPSLSPSPSPSPTPTVESIMITYFGSEKTGFTMHVGDNPIQLGATIVPIEITDGITWSSSDESVITVDQTGLVEAVGNGTAYVIVRCYNGAAECLVDVR